jgi:hypothetical protein
VIGCTVAEIARRMSWREYQEWQIFDAMEPIGFRRADLLAAHHAQWALAPHVKDMPPAEAFMPFDERRFDPPKDDADEAEFTIGGWLAAARKAGMVIRKEGQD